jgi:UDP-N-acetylglucosamine acyltransferase
MPEVHPAAVVSPRAELAEGVRIGPYSIIGDRVRIGRDTTLESHVVVEGCTEIGERNRIHSFVSIGSAPQDVGYKGEETRVVIGNGNLIKEFVTINRATTKKDWVTIVGDDNYLMAYAHIAHDCRLGNKIIMSNVATLGGHTVIGDHANLGGLVAVHQFVRIGAYAFVGGKSGVDRDVPPFMIVAGERARLYGLNRRGLVRHGFSQEAIDGLKRAYRMLWRENRSFADGISRVRQEIPSFPQLEMLLSFFEGSKRGILRE